MNKEELVRQIQEGNTDLYITLWEAVCDLVAWWAKKYYYALKTIGNVPQGVEIEDLIQCGYFAMVDAVAGYDPSKGAFTTYLGFHVKKEYRRAIGRTNRQLHDPLNYAFSLDAPLDNSDPDSGTWFAVAADKPDNRDDFAAVDEKIFQAQLRDALESALDALPEKQSQAIRSEYFEGCGLKETAEKMNCSLARVQQLRNNGLHQIRYSSSCRELEKFLDDQTDFYKYTGLSNYNHTQTSQVEKLVIKRDYLRNKYAELFS